MSAPDSCPTCATKVPPGATRCPACGRVFGEENRCPHCHAIAALRPSVGGPVCAACGKSRTGSVVLAEDHATSRVDPDAIARRHGRLSRLAGIVGLGAGVLGAVLAYVFAPAALALPLSLAVGLVGVGGGFWALRNASREREAAIETHERVLVARIRRLVSDGQRALSAADVAQKLGVDEAAADRVLTSMVGDGSEVDVDVDEEGVVRFVFKEVGDPRVRVEVGSALDDEVEPVAEESSAQRSQG